MTRSYTPRPETATASAPEFADLCVDLSNVIIDDRLAGCQPGVAVRKATGYADRDALVDRCLEILETVDLCSAPIADLVAYVAFMDAMAPRCGRLVRGPEGRA